jgi:hypothetical protein
VPVASQEIEQFCMCVLGVLRLSMIYLMDFVPTVWYFWFFIWPFSKIYMVRFGLGLWCLMPLSTIFQLYHGSLFYWWRKLKYMEKTTDLSQTNCINYCCMEYTSLWTGFKLQQNNPVYNWTHLTNGGCNRIWNSAFWQRFIAYMNDI